MESLNRSTVIDIRNSSLNDRVAYVIATGAGAGFAPIAPGTFGSIEGVGIYLAIMALPVAPQSHMVLVLGTALLSFAIGVWASNRACRITGLKDPGSIVIDEVSGQLIALTPLALAPSLAGAVLAFLLFRLFDIFKPYPIRKLEQLPSGLGVMSDDALAGVYTAALLWLALHFHLV
jgi:phosphatidylglycerophosphatase A